MYRGTLLRRMLAETCQACEACDDGCEQANAEKPEPIPGFSYRTQRDAAQAHDLAAAQPARRDEPKFLAMGGPGPRLETLARLIRHSRGECVPAGPDVLVVPIRMGDKIPQQADEVIESVERALRNPKRRLTLTLACGRVRRRSGGWPRLWPACAPTGGARCSLP